MNRVPIYLLETLAALHAEKTLVRAAQALGTTQSTVTRHLQQLQTYFGPALFETRGNRKLLSPFGDQLARTATARLGDLQTVLHQVTLDSGNDERTPLRIVARREILRRYFANAAFKRPVHLSPQGRLLIRQGLQKHEPDIAITQEKIDTADYIRRELFEDYWGALVPRKVLKGAGDWRQAVAKAGLPLASYTTDVPETPDANPHLVFEDWDFLEARVAAAKNWAVVPNSYVRADAKAYRFFPLKGTSQTFYLYYRKSLRDSEVVKALLAR